MTRVPLFATRQVAAVNRPLPPFSPASQPTITHSFLLSPPFSQVSRTIRPPHKCLSSSKPTTGPSPPFHSHSAQDDGQPPTTYLACLPTGLTVRLQMPGSRVPRHRCSETRTCVGLHLPASAIEKRTKTSRTLCEKRCLAYCLPPPSSPSPPPPAAPTADQGYPLASPPRSHLPPILGRNLFFLLLQHESLFRPRQMNTGATQEKGPRQATPPPVTPVPA